MGLELNRRDLLKRAAKLIGGMAAANALPKETDAALHPQVSNDEKELGPYREGGIPVRELFGKPGQPEPNDEELADFHIERSAAPNEEKSDEESKGSDQPDRQ